MNASPAPSVVRAAAFGLLLVLALLTGAVALRYGWPGQPFAAPLTNLAAQRELLVLHAVAAGLALMLAPWQFLTSLRERRPRLHRALGWGYAASLLVGGLAALLLATLAEGGPLARLDFGLLALLWLGTAAVALVHIRARRVGAHRRWMLRSFALTTAGITLRLQMGLFSLFGLAFEAYYTVLAWSCWLPQALWLEWWLRRAPQPAAEGPPPPWPDTRFETR